MNDIYYSKETIDAKLDAIHETAKRIEIQTLKTNGRVTDLELTRAKNAGASKVIAIIAAFASSLFFAGIEYLLNHK